MEWNVPENEHAYLQSLAERQSEIAALPFIEERKQLWFDLNEAAWADSIRTTLAATKSVGVEFVARDVYTVHGDLENVHRAV